ncbi:MAG TPA: chemotaxis protein CheA [Gammaproteobacteria bacterium]|nr:chemotaxis protein CheA [Gammaproteobacteria bacterium]
MSQDEDVQLFETEAGELLDDMEQSLLQLENNPGDMDHINSVFRAAHTIKGSAGLFAYEALIGFTHGVESVLDRVRAGELAISQELLSLLLSCRDVMGQLVDAAVAGHDGGSAEVQQKGRALSAQLDTYLEDSLQVPEPHLAASDENPGRESVPADTAQGDYWHISIRFGHDVLRNGMDPQSFIRYLGTQGDIVSLVTLWDEMPAAEYMDPESCYLAFEIEFDTDLNKLAIEEIFQFVIDDCRLRILPPLTKLPQYQAVIEETDTDEQQRLGEILVKSGATTSREIDEALQQQTTTQTNSEPDEPIGKVLLREGVVLPEVIETAVAKQKQVRENQALANKSIRVSADKLEQLIDLVGELVISSANTRLLGDRTRDTALIESLENMSRLVEDIRDTGLGLRMVPIGETFNRFRRVVRDVSQSMGKDIELELSGSDKELDKTVVEKIGDPLMHLVRNAIDHGIESAETRQENNKPARGKLKLNAYHDSGSIVIEVEDDGGGLPRDKILDKARQLGLVSPNQSLSDQEVYRLIFEPGFSTAEQVTNISGRGVGMDVVRRNIEALRGQVDVESRPGKGSRFSIRLPLTLAIIDGFLVRVGDASYVIPLDMVEECVELPAHANDDQANEYINLRGEVLPFIHLGELFRETGGRSRRENIVVTSFAGQKAGLVVDELLGEYQTVIKPLGKIFSHLEGVSGATILGSGEVAMIIDVPELIQRVAMNGNRRIRDGVEMPSMLAH